MRDVLAGHRVPCSLEQTWIEILILCDSGQQFTHSYFPSKLSALVSICKKPNIAVCVLNMCVTRKLLTHGQDILHFSNNTREDLFQWRKDVVFLAKNLLLVFSIKPEVLKFLLISWGNFSDKWNKSKFC